MKIMLLCSSVILNVVFASRAEFRAFSFTSVSRLLPISCADTAVHGAVEISQVNQIKTLEPFLRLLIFVTLTLFYWSKPCKHIQWYENWWVGRAWLRKICLEICLKLVTICDNIMSLCICPLEQETAYVNSSIAFKICSNLVNGILLLMHGESWVCSQVTCTSGLAGLQVLQTF